MLANLNVKISLGQLSFGEEAVAALNAANEGDGKDIYFSSA